MDQIQEIIPPALPYGLEDKVFQDCDDEGNHIGMPYSYNDAIRILQSFAGVNEDLIGK
jgi:hypothetical protein